MIKANDFRYLNWLNYKGNAFQVNDIFGASGLLTVLPNVTAERPGRLSMHDFEPIPLSEEWLKRLGFESGDDCFYKNLRPTMWGYLNLQTEDYSVSISPDIGGIHVPGNEIKFLHQLQNLFYALTGQELEISR